jgi:hypothetical protein
VVRDLFRTPFVCSDVNDDELRARLRAFGEEPIDAQTRAVHQRLMAAAAGSGEREHRRGLVWAGIAGAAVVGFLAGSTGLAMADALPDPAQEVAHDVLGAVQVDVPEGKEGKRGPCVSEAAKIKDKDAKKAAMDACPKGGPDNGGDDDGDQGQGPPPSDDPCRGRPPWAGPMSKEQREAAKESASRANCPDDEGGDADEREDGGGGPPAPDDPCRGRPPWAGPMSKEQREAAKASASRANCPDDDQGEDEQEDANETATVTAATTVAPVPTETTPVPSTTEPSGPSSTMAPSSSAPASTSP